MADGDRNRTPTPRDAGRTSGGGNLGHVQPERVEREGKLRNNADEREDDEPTLPQTTRR